MITFVQTLISIYRSQRWSVTLSAFWIVGWGSRASWRSFCLGCMINHSSARSSPSLRYPSRKNPPIICLRGFRLALHCYLFVYQPASGMLPFVVIGFLLLRRSSLSFLCNAFVCFQNLLSMFNVVILDSSLSHSCNAFFSSLHQSKLLTNCACACTLCSLRRRDTVGENASCHTNPCVTVTGRTQR